MKKQNLVILKKALTIITKDHIKPCRGFMIGCPNCEVYLLAGLLGNFIADLSWGEKK